MHSTGHTVAVVIPTLNAADGFPAVLSGLRGQTVRPDEIVVIDSGSTDGTRALAASYGCRVLEISPCQFDHGGTRNMAMRSTSSDITIFMTQDAVPADERMIDELIQPLDDANVAIAYGRQLPRPGAGRLERFAREYHYPATSVMKDRETIAKLGLRAFFCSNSCSAVRRDTFEKLGGFREGVYVNEDMLFAATAMKAGRSIFYAAEAKVYHSHPFSLAWSWCRYFRTGRFLAANRQVLSDIEVGRYGGGLVQKGIAVFWSEHAFPAMAGLLLETAFKAVAVKAGWYYEKLFVGKGPSDEGSKCSQHALKQPATK